MNIVQVCPNPFPALGGPAKTYRQFQEAAGARSIGFLAPGDGAGESAVVSLASTVRTLGGRGVRRYYYAPRARLQQAESVLASADLVFLHGLFTHPPVWAAGFCRRRGIPYAVALHGILDPWALRKSRTIKSAWMARFGGPILQNAAAVVCATRREAEKVAHRSHRMGPIEIVNWACEIPDRARIDRRRPELRRKLGLAESDRVIAFLGRVHSMKRPRETVRAMAELGSVNLKLLMIGPNDDVSRDELEAEARRLGWSGLKVVGPVFGEEKFDYLGAADAFVSLSHRENFNYALAEAMAAGLPPILSPGNDLGWEFAGEGFSWQLKTNNAAEARTALGDFLHLPERELRRRGSAARHWAEDRLSLGRLRIRLGEVAASAEAWSGR